MSNIGLRAAALLLVLLACGAWGEYQPNYPDPNAPQMRSVPWDGRFIAIDRAPQLGMDYVIPVGNVPPIGKAWCTAEQYRFSWEQNWFHHCLSDDQIRRMKQLMQQQEQMRRRRWQGGY